MQAFIAKLSQEDQLFYAKVGIYTSVLTKHLPKKLVAAAETKLDNQDLLLVCKHAQPKELSKKVLDRLTKYKQTDGSNCLHMAARYCNIAMARHLVGNKIIDPNSVNLQLQTPLTYMLKYSMQLNFSQMALYLLRSTDLRKNDLEGKHPHEIELALYNEPRSRILKEINDIYESL